MDKVSLCRPGWPKTEVRLPLPPRETSSSSRNGSHLLFTQVPHSPEVGVGCLSKEAFCVSLHVQKKVARSPAPTPLWVAWVQTVHMVFGPAHICWSDSGGQVS